MNVGEEGANLPQSQTLPAHYSQSRGTGEAKLGVNSFKAEIDKSTKEI